ncbi:MAG: hypothetical protein J7M08_01395, partial [Planctomycetes bacterium]|nr:hypothetical protein [Planctomycetota bacterium]
MKDNGVATGTDGARIPARVPWGIYEALTVTLLFLALQALLAGAFGGAEGGLAALLGVGLVSDV